MFLLLPSFLFSHRYHSSFLIFFLLFFLLWSLYHVRYRPHISIFAARHHHPSSLPSSAILFFVSIHLSLSFSFFCVKFLSQHFPLSSPTYTLDVVISYWVAPPLFISFTKSPILHSIVHQKKNDLLFVYSHRIRFTWHTICLPVQFGSLKSRLSNFFGLFFFQFVRCKLNYYLLLISVKNYK